MSLIICSIFYLAGLAIFLYGWIDRELSNVLVGLVVMVISGGGLLELVQNKRVKLIACGFNFLAGAVIVGYGLYPAVGVLLMVISGGGLVKCFKEWKAKKPAESRPNGEAHDIRNASRVEGVSLH